MEDRMDAAALAAVEQAIEALAGRDPAAARMAVAAAFEKDRTGAFGTLADAVHLAAWRLETDDEIDEATWNHLYDAVGPGRLQALIDQARG